MSALGSKQFTFILDLIGGLECCMNLGGQNMNNVLLFVLGCISYRNSTKLAIDTFFFFFLICQLAALKKNNLKFLYLYTVKVDEGNHPAALVYPHNRTPLMSEYADQLCS